MDSPPFYVDLLFRQQRAVSNDDADVAGHFTDEGGDEATDILTFGLRWADGIWRGIKIAEVEQRDDIEDRAVEE